MGMFDNHWWGLRAPDGASVAWGARAIDDGRTFGLLHDRQSSQGEKAERDALAKRLNGGVLAACQKEFARLKDEGEIRPNEGNRVTLYNEGGLKVEGNTNGSHGYLYVCAYMVEEDVEDDDSIGDGGEGLRMAGMAGGNRGLADYGGLDLDYEGCIGHGCHGCPECDPD